MDRLLVLATRVAKTHNGKNFPRREQIDAIRDLQDFIQQIEKEDLTTSGHPESAPSTPQLSKP